ncbi:MAG: plasmid pRiA4b ORF-3 family protein [Anaerolineae bacterium]|nr:plasmid pRiA4b ORF-3 family protein [Anaerolineae bacterium]
MSKTRSKSEAPIYQIKITLKDSKPPIWRRLLVPGDVTLGNLHDIIQTAMGWYDCHLHQFILGGVYYGVPSDEDWYDVEDESRYKLNQIAPREKSQFTYEYDFGDSWHHIILVEKILPPDPSQDLPVCVKGKRACPPEDVGGIWGYDTFLEAINDPDHEEHDEYLEWIDDAFDPEEFDLDTINGRLSDL